MKAGPMSVGVPIEGTDTVAGLRALERRAATSQIGGLLDEAAKVGEESREGERGAGDGATAFPTTCFRQAFTPAAATPGTRARTSSRSPRLL
jgi:hypothetical protein